MDKTILLLFLLLCSCLVSLLAQEKKMRLGILIEAQKGELYQNRKVLTIDVPAIKYESKGIGVLIESEIVKNLILSFEPKFQMNILKFQNILFSTASTDRKLEFAMPICLTYLIRIRKFESFVSAGYGVSSFLKKNNKSDQLYKDYQTLIGQFGFVFNFEGIKLCPYFGYENSLSNVTSNYRYAVNAYQYHKKSVLQLGIKIRGLKL